MVQLSNKKLIYRNSYFVFCHSQWLIFEKGLEGFRFGPIYIINILISRTEPKQLQDVAFAMFMIALNVI